MDKLAAIEVKRLAIKPGKLGKNTDRYPNNILGHFASALALCEVLLNDKASKLFLTFGEQLDFPGFDAE